VIRVEAISENTREVIDFFPTIREAVHYVTSHGWEGDEETACYVLFDGLGVVGTGTYVGAPEGRARLRWVLTSGEVETYEYVDAPPTYTYRSV
jgi:hypothetical protein